MTTTPHQAAPSAPHRSEDRGASSGFLHLAVIYLIWGSTYLAIRIAVREGSGFPPFMMGATRVLLAGLTLLAWAAIRRRPLRIERSDRSILIVSGLLLWLGGNGLVTWAEQRAHSGYAALLVGSMPLWVSLMEAIVDGRPPSRRLAAALVIGFAGVALLTVPVLLSNAGANAAAANADLASVLALLGAPISWGAGAMLQRRRPVRLGLTASSGYQMLFGSIGYALVALLVAEPWPAPTPEAWAAWGYLVVFGSIIAFTSFVKALRILPINVVMTYAYVNPVVAVLIGSLVLDEPITAWTIVGTALILLGVAGVFHKRGSGSR